MALKYYLSQNLRCNEYGNKKSWRVIILRIDIRNYAKCEEDLSSSSNIINSMDGVLEELSKVTVEEFPLGETFVVVYDLESWSGYHYAGRFRFISNDEVEKVFEYIECDYF